MNIEEMTFDDIEERRAQIAEEMNAENADVDALTAEARALLERKTALKAAEEERKKTAEEVASGKLGEVKEEHTESTQEERAMFGKDSKEYRDAFMAALVGKETVEQRAILADNTTYGDGLALPVALDREIWDQVATAHPIIGDVDVRRTGVAIKVTKMTPAAITKKMDSAVSTEQTFTSAEVTLVGADYHTYVNLSYAEAKMSQGAMEDFLVREIADAIGEAVAKDVFARILTDAGAGQKVTATSDLFADVKSALGLAVQARRPVIYAPATEYYNIVGAIAQGSPFNIGNTLGCEVKLDTAATKITILDPTLFVLNVIEDATVESQKDVQNAQFVIGGYMRAEGCLRKTKAAAYIN